jgi:peptidoglycan/xylan/chitin deacetylase (PgdA/CDA1 family)
MRRAILFFLIVAPIITVLVWRTSPLAAVGVLFVSHMLVLYPTLRPNAQWLGPVMTAFQTKEPEVWLTIDDGPTDDTPAILALLDSYGVKATFFCKGAMAREKPELLREMLHRGHSIGNHSYSHPSATFWCLSPSRVAREVTKANDAIRNVSGGAPRLFRAPVGMKNPAVHPVLERADMRLIGWSARAFDTQTADVEAIAARVLRGLKPGAIILMHQGMPHSAHAIGRVVETLQQRGYRFVVPDESRLKTNR